MSLHIKLTPEAEARMKAQRRNSTILSFIVSGLFIALILLVFGLIAFKVIQPSENVIICEYGPEPIPTEPVRPKVKNFSPAKSKAPASASRISRNIAVNAVSPVSIPTVDNIDINRTGVGMSDDGFYGTGIDDIGTIGNGNDKFRLVDEVCSKRCTKEDRLERLNKMGGKIEAEAAVEKGLEWLKQTQNADGSWSNRNVAAMTGFGLLAYLGRCETPISEKYGDSCMSAIVYLVDLGLKNNGKLSTNTADKHWPYEHAIATYALCEAVSFSKALGYKVPDLKEVTEKAVNVIIENQHKSGGWDYAYDTEGNRGGDLSIAAWHVQALKAASHMGIDIKGLDKAKKKAIEYVESLQGENGGFGYTSKPSGETYAKLTGAGVLCLQMDGRKHESKIRRGAKHILEFTKFDYSGKDSNLYSHYYESQAMIARGGSDWDKYNDIFSDQLINSQNPNGSWKVPGSGGHYTNVHYTTCLNILMLEVYYRFLPGTGDL